MDEHKLECKVSNSKTELTYCMTPSGMNEGGQCGAIEVGGDTNFKDDAWNANLKLSTGGFEVGPMKPWTTVSINCRKMQIRGIRDSIRSLGILKG